MHDVSTATRFYYAVKPFLPWRLRIAMRRISAQRKRAIERNAWPILPAAATPPEGWRGWPGGARFALVLTHDVETAAGLEKCREVMDVEQQLGLRSSFNFIPEGPYRSSAAVRAEVLGRGCEVGVHDLKHNGKLFFSRPRFHSDAQRINQYLRAWGSCGFRSGFMLRNLDWLHDLDIRYDSSTFDTDPFEPQPDGLQSIFPTWIANAQNPRRGYVELPYTLPQDSTLFIILREPTPSIWIEKLKWIADHGGMALVNVHPDYVRLTGSAPTTRTYPLAHYQRFLEYVAEHYANAYWNPLPREVAAFAAEALTEPARTVSAAAAQR